MTRWILLIPLLIENSLGFENEVEPVGSTGPAATVRVFEGATSLRNLFLGDSLSDTGNLSDIIGGLGEAYPGASLTNGLTWPAYLDPGLARITGVLPVPPETAPAPITTSLDLSVGAATSEAILGIQAGTTLDFFLPAFQPTRRDRPSSGAAETTSSISSILRSYRARAKSKRRSTTPFPVSPSRLERSGKRVFKKSP